MLFLYLYRQIVKSEIGLDLQKNVDLSYVIVVWPNAIEPTVLFKGPS